MELRHLRYFVAVAEVENVTLAAEALHVSQPPLSRQIQQLEDEMGVALFERTAKSLRLTKAGEVFARECRLILKQVDQAVAAARKAGGDCREFNIGYAPSLTVKILPRILRHLREKIPEVTIHLHDLTTGEMLKRLKLKRLDLALVVYPGSSALRGFVFHELHRHPACAVLEVGHPLAREPVLRIEQLLADKVIAFTRSDYPEYRRWLSSVFKSSGRRPKIVEEHDSITSLIASVEAGNGIAFGGDGFQKMAGARVKVVRLAPPAPPILVGAIYEPQSLDPVIQQMLRTFDFVES